MAWLTGIMREGMNTFFQWSGSYGVAIILLTILIRVVLVPFTLSQMRMTRKMQELQPELKRLQEKFKKDPQRLNQETMALWKRARVNPLSGCLPLLLQFPFLIALFNVLQQFNYAAQPSFLWLADLSKADGTYLLPILAAVTTWWQSKITAMPGQNDPTQRTMTVAMPLMIGWMATRFASGLSLYWVVSNLLGVVQQYLMVRPAPRPAKGEAK